MQQPSLTTPVAPGISLWIKSGVDPVEVAHRAGHSLTVLYRFYAKILKGGSARANSLIEQGLQAEDER